MKLYLFERLDSVSRNWHSEGGLVIVAKDRRQAKAVIAAYNEQEKAAHSWVEGDTVLVTTDDWKKAVVFNLAGDEKPRLFVFPDAGCC